MGKKKDKLLTQMDEHLSDETVLAAVEGTYETKLMGNDHTRGGVLVATDKRLLFFAKKMGGFQLESFPYSNISSFEQGKSMMGGQLSFFASGNKVQVKWIQDPDLPKLVEAVRNQTSHSAPSSAPAPAPAPTAVDPMEQLKKLAELRDAGLLTPDEFEEKRTQIVASM